MKANTNCHEELLRYYQTWLMDFSKLTVRHGICHPNICIYHNLTVGRLYFPGKEPVIAIVPQRLQKIIYGKSTEASLFSLDDDVNISLCVHEHLLAHHPMLAGILLSECVRLKQRPLVRKLVSLFQQFSGTPAFSPSDSMCSIRMTRGVITITDGTRQKGRYLSVTAIRYRAACAMYRSI